jgi:hypothetical protein
MHKCPVCGYDKLRRPYQEEDIICPSCGTEFGYTDATRRHAELRQRWRDNGAHWYSQVNPEPVGWNGYKQLLDAGLIEYTVTAPESKPRVSLIDFGEETIRVSFQSISGEIKTRVVDIIGNPIPSLLSSISSISAKA